MDDMVANVQRTVQSLVRWGFFHHLAENDMTEQVFLFHSCEAGCWS